MFTLPRLLTGDYKTKENYYYMNVKKLVSALAVLAASVSAIAQTSPDTPLFETSAGLLGHRYAEYSVGYLDVNHSDNDAFGAGLAVNLPVAPSFDMLIDYTYSWGEGRPNIDSHDLSATGIYYLSSGPLKPFGGLTLGYNWNDFDDDPYWGVRAGVEYELNSRVVLTATVGYDDNFNRGDNGLFDGTVRANYWFTRNVSGYAAVSIIEGGHAGFAAGVTLRF